jgi:predicted Ser/Thr protein kinase
MRRPVKSDDVAAGRRGRKLPGSGPRSGSGSASAAQQMTPPQLPALSGDADRVEEDGHGERDMRLGRLLIEAGKITSEHVEQCLKLQDDMAVLGGDTVPKLGELLVRKGYATPSQVEQALELQEAAGRTCPSCGEFCPALLLDMEDAEKCLHCGTRFPERTRISVSVPKETTDKTPKIVPVLKPHLTQVPVSPELKNLGKYELLKELGRGSMGVVYEALDTSLNRKVALKLLHPLPGPGFRESAQDVQQFVKEAQLSGNLPKHPHIVTVYEAGLLDHRHFIAMERIEGLPLSAWRRKSSVTIRQQARLLRDVALAVHHAHENGILHCDLKPQNVMVDDRNRPYVTDFGLARRPGRDTWAMQDDGMTAGTPAYMSPEQAKGLLQMDRKTDIYSLGVMLYEIFAGRLPFRAKTAEELLNKTVGEPVRPPSSVARSLASIDPGKAIDAICLKALAKKPAHRYATARALADDLTRWLRGEALPGKPVRRDPRKIGIRIAAAAVIVLAAWLGLRAWAGPEDEPAASPVRIDELRQARLDLDRARLAMEQKVKADAAELEAERRKVAALQQQAKAVPPPVAVAHEPVEWLVIGPFENHGLDEVLPPEQSVNLAAGIPGKGGVVRWKKGLPELRSASSGRAAVFDLASLFTPNTQTLAYATIHVKAPAAMDALLLVGSDDGVKVWVNGTVVHRHEQGRGVRIDEDHVPVRLLKGWNQLLFKVTQWNQGWGLSVRVTDPSQRPIDELEYDPLGDLPRVVSGR